MAAASALDRPRGLQRLSSAVFVACLAAGLVSCNDPGGGPAGSATPNGAAWASAAPNGDDPATPVPTDPAGFDPALEARPTPLPGPDLGAIDRAPMDPELFVPSPYGLVASDRLWFLLPEASSEADAERVASAMHGTLGGRLEAADLWLVLIPPQSPDGILFALEFAGEIPGIDAVFPDAEVALQADCAPELTTGLYSGTNADPYAMIGVPKAWQTLFASGQPRAPVHIGVVDSALTTDPKNRTGWDFDNVTFVGDPETQAGVPTDATGAVTGDGFRHADGVLGIIAADRADGGIAGIASPLGGNLMVSHSDFTKPDPTATVSTVLSLAMKQVEGGATIVNLSVGYGTVGPEHAATAAAWKRFLAKMEREHPEVLFVAAAGNQSGLLDGSNYAPGGIKAANLMTVGSAQTDGTGTDYSNEVDPTAEDGEVTIHAPGDQAVWGQGVSGTIRAAGGGTSSATPMVTATAALMRSVNPDLTAAQIKEMIVAASQDSVDLFGDQPILSVDSAVRAAIDDARVRAGKPKLTDEEIAGAACEIDIHGEIVEAIATPPGTRWALTAALPTIAAPTSITLLVGGARPTDWRKAVASSGETVAWSVLAPEKGVVVTVTRLDNGYWLQHTLRGAPAASPTPAATPTPTPTPTPRPTPKPADPGDDCSNPPASGAGTIAYLKWSLGCGGAISP